jgi:hypothetical protein
VDDDQSQPEIVCEEELHLMSAKEKQREDLDWFDADLDTHELPASFMDVELDGSLLAEDPSTTTSLLSQMDDLEFKVRLMPLNYQSTSNTA